jgi:hypothetical protein
MFEKGRLQLHIVKKIDEPVSRNFDKRGVILRSEKPSFYDLHVRTLIDNYVRRQNKKQQ